MLDILRGILYFDQASSQITSIEEIKKRNFAYEAVETGADDDQLIKRRFMPFGMQIRQAASIKQLKEQEKAASLMRYSLNKNNEKKTEQDDLDDLDDILGSISDVSISQSSSSDDFDLETGEIKLWSGRALFQCNSNMRAINVQL